MPRIYLLSHLSLALIWLYHGLVPKLLVGHAQEVRMNDALIPFVERDLALLAVGIGEALFAIVYLLLYRHAWPNYLSIFFGLATIPPLLLVAPDLFGHAFNPFSTNLGLASLALINLWSHPNRRPL